MENTHGHLSRVFRWWKSRSLWIRLPVLLVAGYLLLVLLVPAPLFEEPESTVLCSRDGQLLGARISGNGQWHFPPQDSVPPRFEQCILHFEDRHFRRHPGVNPVSLLRALVLNIREGEIVSGGSTLSMQVARLSRQGKSRTVWQKMVEITLAFKLELTHSKDEILALYTGHAPFGGNVIGLEAAAWRYYGCRPEDLSWGESATLAVLPNAPALIFPGRMENRLMDKRNHLLDLLLERGVIDSLTCRLSKVEPLPGKPLPLPAHSPHLLDKALMEHPGERVQTTIDFRLQQQLNRKVADHAEKLAYNQIHNLAALVLSTETGEVLAYTGNAPVGEEHAPSVDLIQSPRSTGSILKPLLYAALLQDGELLPHSLIRDVPVRFGGFTPKNFDENYNGAVPASMALSRSLNIPSVHMLRQYKAERFLHLLRDLGLTTLDKPADHYGLSLILGGGEATLWELAGMYAGMGRVLNQFNETEYYFADAYRPPTYVRETLAGKHNPIPDARLSAASLWWTFRALQEVHRPESEAGWERLDVPLRLAWKTGTSFGFRDAWAIGTTPDYVVAVWAGNADGEGRPGLTGVTAAAPLLFDVFSLLPTEQWYESPMSELVPVAVCRQSGYRAGPNCSEVDTLLVPVSGRKTAPCPYHYRIHLDAYGQHRVHADCYPREQMQERSWFVLPPSMEWYYRQQHPLYRPLPPYHPDCEGVEEEVPAMEFLYPYFGSRVLVPRELDGRKGKVVFEAAHRNPEATLYWYLGETFLGTTHIIHQMSASPPPGEYVLTIIDGKGRRLERKIMIE